MQTRRDVFHAIADPTRREIIALLARQPMNVNTVAGEFDMSRPAVAKHLKVLTECGLVTLSYQGRETVCVARLEELNEVSDWVHQYRKFWEAKLDSLASFLEEAEQKKKHTGKGKKHHKHKHKHKHKS